MRSSIANPFASEDAHSSYLKGIDLKTGGKRWSSKITVKMSEISKRFFWASVYAMAMALLEAVVVAYLRVLLQISDEHVALGVYVPLEIGREVATIVMLVAVGWLAGRKGLDRWAYGLFAFGLWDIWYYVWMADSLHALLQGRPDWDTLRPQPFQWPLFLVALVLMAAPSLMATWPGRMKVQPSPAKIPINRQQNDRSNI
jgi:hypothetical protein